MRANLEWFCQALNRHEARCGDAVEATGILTPRSGGEHPTRAESSGRPAGRTEQAGRTLHRNASAEGIISEGAGHTTHPVVAVLRWRQKQQLAHAARPNSIIVDEHTDTTE